MIIMKMITTFFIVYREYFIAEVSCKYCTKGILQRPLRLHKISLLGLLDQTFSAIRVGFAAEIIVMGKVGHISLYLEGCSTRQLSSNWLLAGESMNIWNWSSVAEAIY